MAGAGLGRGMRLKARWKHRPILQPRKATGEIAAILREKIGGELIDRNGDNQPGRSGWRCGILGSGAA